MHDHVSSSRRPRPDDVIEKLVEDVETTVRDAGLPHAPAEPRVEPHIERVQRRREALSPRLLQEGEVVFARRADTARDEEHAAGGGRQAERARAVNVQQVRLELAEQRLQLAGALCSQRHRHWLLRRSLPRG